MTSINHPIFWDGLPESSPEARLLFLEETFQTINRLGSEAFFILSPELNIIWANERAASLTGYPLNRLISQEIGGSFPPDRGIIRDLLQSQVLRSELKISSEVRIVTALFEIREVEISMASGQTRLGGKRVYVVMKDVTVSKSIETRLLDAHKALQKIIEMGNDGILVFDQDYRIEFANSLASKITDFPKDQLIGMDFRLLLSPRIGSSCWICRPRCDFNPMKIGRCARNSISSPAP